MRMNHSANRAISEAIEKHWITSASILVPCPWFLEAAAFGKAHRMRIWAFTRPSARVETVLRWGPSSKDKVASLLDRLPAARARSREKRRKPAEVETGAAPPDRARARVRRTHHASRHAHGCPVAAPRISTRCTGSSATPTRFPFSKNGKARMARWEPSRSPTKCWYKK